MRDAAYDRVINGGEFEHNTKMQRVLEIANQGKKDGKPGVVFARRLQSVAALKEGLEKAGHRVVTLTGTMTGDEKDAARRAFAPDSKNDADATADIIIMSDAGNTGLNLQRGKWIAHIDTPYTGPVKEQRDARINRLGQTEDVDVHQLLTNTPYDGKAARRLTRKQQTSHVFQNPADHLDDSGLAGYVHTAYSQITKGKKAKMTGQATGVDKKKERRAAVDTARVGKQEGQRKRNLGRDRKKAGGRDAVMPTAQTFESAASPKEVITSLIGAYKKFVPADRWAQVETVIRQGVGKKTGMSSEQWQNHANQVAAHIHDFVTEYYE